MLVREPSPITARCRSSCSQNAAQRLSVSASRACVFDVVAPTHDGEITPVAPPLSLNVRELHLLQGLKTSVIFPPTEVHAAGHVLAQFRHVHTMEGSVTTVPPVE